MYTFINWLQEYGLLFGIPISLIVAILFRIFSKWMWHSDSGNIRPFIGSISATLIPMIVWNWLSIQDLLYDWIQYIDLNSSLAGIIFFVFGMVVFGIHDLFTRTNLRHYPVAELILTFTLMFYVFVLIDTNARSVHYGFTLGSLSYLAIASSSKFTQR